MKKILITGSEGFAGQHLWRELDKNSYKVFGTVFSSSLEDISSNLYFCDIEDQPQLSSLIKKIKPDAIFHLAGQPKPGLSFNIPQRTISVNTIGTINLLEAVRSISGYFPRILIIGTSEEHGIVSSKDLPITENTPLNPINPYAISKTANWFLAKEYVRSFNFDIIYVAPFTHTGPGQMPGFLSPDVASQIVEIEKGLKEPILHTGDLSSKRDISDVRDVVRAYRLLLEKGKTGERYIISTGKSIPVSEIVKKLVSMSKVKIDLKIDNTRTRPTDIPNLIGDHSKLSRITGWEPAISLDQTLQDLLNWYRQKK
ncbi:MAG: GDP-mannose 4,6-dehydratase [Candidatus Shapirobacteria bacterium]